jgi:MFS superfamily sulfate permease-like transporter
MPLSALFKPDVRVEQPDDKTHVVKVFHFAVFSNWIMLRHTIVSLNGDRAIILDLSETRLVDHTVMEKLHEMERDFEQQNRKFTVVGLDNHMANSSHPYAARTMLARARVPESPPESGAGNQAPGANVSHAEANGQEVSR